MKNGTPRSKTGKKIAFIVIILIVALYTFLFISGRRQDPEPVADEPFISAPADSQAVETAASDEPNDLTHEPEPDPVHEPEHSLEMVRETEPGHERESEHSHEPEHAPDTTLQDKTITDTLDEIAARYNCAAVSLAVFSGDGGFYTYQYGYADEAEGRMVDANTKFRVASLSKLVTAMCAMTLVDEGKIDLDTDISEYAGYSIRNPAYADTAITCRMLLEHTSSLFDSDDFSQSRSGNSSRSTRELLDAGTSYRKREPGSRHDYTNFGFSVLGGICEIVSGKSLNTLAREVLFEPLAIDAAYTPGDLNDPDSVAVIYNQSHNVSRSVKSQLDIGASDVPGHDHHLAQGNLTISALDYAKLLAMLTNGGTLGGVRILSEVSAGAIQTATLSAGAYKQGLAVRFQSGAFLGEDVYWHTGSAYGELTQFIYDASSRFGMVVLTTGSNSGRADNGMINVCNKLTEAVWKRTDLI